MDDLTSLLARSPEIVARSILGWTLTVVDRERGQTVGGVVVEVEAYLPQGDPAAHSHRGKSPANASQFGPAGTLYVHAMRQHVLADIVTEDSSRPGSVLLRALEPTEGLALMRARRGVERAEELCRGPGNLCRALGITRAFDRLDILAPNCPVRLTPALVPSTFTIARSPRIEVGRDLPCPLRFFVQGSRFVSRSGAARSARVFAIDAAERNRALSGG